METEPTPAPASEPAGLARWMSSAPRLHLLCLGMVAVVAFLFLFSPPPKTEPEYCGWWVELGPGGILVNCDSRSFVEPAQDLSLLLSPRHMRQARPLYILAGKVGGLVIDALTLGRIEIPYFWGYVALNFLLLELGLFLLMKICRPPVGDEFFALAGALVLSCNHVTKSFLWTPHQQMFSIFTPLLAVYLCRRAIRSPVGTARAAAWGTLAGLLALAYGNFLVLAPVLLLGMALGDRRSGRPMRQSLGPSAVLVVTAAAPTLAWMGVVTLLTGSYYNHELETYRQLIWMADAMRQGPGQFLMRLAVNSRKFVSTLVGVEVLPFLVLAGAATVARRLRDRASSVPADAGATTLPAAAIVLAAVGLLFWLLGYYHERLTFTLVPAALVIATIESARLLANHPAARARARAGAVIAAAGWCLYHVLAYGPFR